MSSPLNICNIVCENKEDYDLVVEYLKNYPITVVDKFENVKNTSPTLIVGWQFVKILFPKHNIVDFEIKPGLFWAHSKQDLKSSKKLLNNIENFVLNSIKSWLPNNFLLFDPFLDKISLEKFVNKHIDQKLPVFFYFREGALYINNAGNNFTVNIKSLSFYDNDYKSAITSFINSHNAIAFSYSNIAETIDDKLLSSDFVTLENLRWTEYGDELDESYFKLISGFDIYKYIPFMMSKISIPRMNSVQKKSCQRLIERDKITWWLSNRDIAMSNDFKDESVDFYKIRKNYKLVKVGYSNKRTITGRINAKDKFNPQSLNKSNDDRKNIISRFGKDGKIYVFDYVAFETRISLYESDDVSFIEKYKNKDLHHETGEILWETKNLDDDQRDLAKTLNHAILYGGGEKLLMDKLMGFPEPEYKLHQVKQFLKPIIDKAEKIKKFVKLNGYSITPWGTIVLVAKEFAGFNNFVQAYASEILVDKLFEIRELLKNRKSKFLFQVHDSLVFDICNEEIGLVGETKNVLSGYNNMEFPVRVECGDNYKELNEVV